MFFDWPSPVEEVHRSLLRLDAPASSLARKLNVDFPCNSSYNTNTLMFSYSLLLCCLFPGFSNDQILKPHNDTTSSSKSTTLPLNESSRQQGPWLIGELHIQLAAVFSEATLMTRNDKETIGDVGSRISRVLRALNVTSSHACCEKLSTEVGNYQILRGCDVGRR